MNTIRVVSLLEGDCPSDIQCTMREVALDSPPAYCAFSYVWGHPSRDFPILVDQKEMLIPRALFMALLHLRSREKAQKFWIDALCINQLDVVERSAQVQKMQEIYARSSGILIWLGSERGESSSAIVLASKVAAYWSNQGLDLRGAESAFRKRSTTDLSALLDQCGCKADAAPVQAFERLLARDWFERVWIIQEATAAVDTKTIQCGDSTIDWWGFVTTAMFLSHAVTRPDLHDYFPNTQLLGSVSMRRLCNLDNLLRKIRTGRYRTDLLGILANYRYYKATDARDKVYALLGLVTKSSAHDLIPDYSLDVSGVYVKVAEHCILRQGSLECFGYCSPSLRDSGLPSWVPDWRNSSTRHPLAVYTKHRPYLDDFDPDVELIYSASADQTFRKDHLFSILDKRRLLAEGFCIGKVVAVSLPNYLDVSDSCGSVIKKWEPSNLAELYRPTGETVLEAFSRTLVADVAKTGRLRHRGYTIDWNFWRSVEDFSRPPPGPEQRTGWGSLLYATVGRSFVRSDRGYLCLAPGETEPGDHICVLLGGHVLYVLRPAGESFHLVGECYVHGFMDGQAMDLLRNGTCELQRFVID